MGASFIVFLLVVLIWTSLFFFFTRHPQPAPPAAVAAFESCSECGEDYKSGWASMHTCAKANSNSELAAASTASSAASDEPAAAAGKRPAAKKKWKDPAAPKRPQSAYFCFAGTMRPKVTRGAQIYALRQSRAFCRRVAAH